MIFSFFVAMAIAPWLMLKLAPREGAAAGDAGGNHGARSKRALGRLSPRRLAILASRRAGSSSWRSAARRSFRSASSPPQVTVKLPFDNSPSFRSSSICPRGELPGRHRAGAVAAAERAHLPEIVSIRPMPAPPRRSIFNGLVRHSYLRSRPDRRSQVNLLPKSDRDREAAPSRSTCASGRGLPALKARSSRSEVPPGPPVLTTLLAEIYGPTLKPAVPSLPKRAKLFERALCGGRRRFLRTAKAAPEDRHRSGSDRVLGVRQKRRRARCARCSMACRSAFASRRRPRSIRSPSRLPRSGLRWNKATGSDAGAANTIPGTRGVVELGDVVTVSVEDGSYPSSRRDGRFAEMVTARTRRRSAPIYGMMDVASAVRARLGRAARTSDSHLTASRTTKQTRPAVGRQSGRSPM